MYFVTPPASLSEPDSDRFEQDAAFYRRVLHELIGQAADVARVLHGAVMAQAATVPPSDAGEAVPAPVERTPEAVVKAADAFERVSRGVRRSIALARQLDEPVAPRVVGRVAVRREMIRRVEDRIGWAASLGGVDVERVEAEFAERLDMADLDEQFADRPLSDIVDDICHDLGLGSVHGASGFKRRTPSDIAALCARAERPAGGGLRAVADALADGESVVASRAPGRIYGTSRFRI